MSAPRRYYGPRAITHRSSFDRLNLGFVPPSRHAIFIRGFPNDIDSNKIRDFFQEASESSCGIDFTSYNEEQRKLSIALRFDSHDVAKEMLTRFDNTEIFGHRVDVTWFKDMKKARDRLINEGRTSYNNEKTDYNRAEYDRRDYRDWPDNRRSFQPNNNNTNRSKSTGKVDANSEASYGIKQSSDYNRSRSKTSQKMSDESDSESEAIKENVYKHSTKKRSPYLIDLDNDDDEDDDGVVVDEPIQKSDRKNENYVSKIEQSLIIDKSELDSEERKKKRKKQKRRRLERSASAESITEPDKVECHGNGAVAISNSANQNSSVTIDLEDFPTIIREEMLALRMKAKILEKKYRQDCETYVAVVDVLTRKAPDLKVALDSLVQKVLLEAGSQCIDLMRECATDR